MVVETYAVDTDPFSWSTGLSCVPMGKAPVVHLTFDEAYQATFLWLDHAGDPPVDVSEPAHGSVELHTEKAFVRVRYSDGPVEQSSVLALLRAAETGKRLLLFSPSGFSAGALSIAETQGIALFSLDRYGRAIAETTHARSIAPDTEPDPPFAPEDVEDDGDDGDDGDDFWSHNATFKTADINADSEEESDEEGAEGIDATTTDWSDCPSCGTTHYRSANFCKSCGTSLLSDARKPDASPRCEDCGSHNIEYL